MKYINLMGSKDSIETCYPERKPDNRISKHMMRINITIQSQSHSSYKYTRSHDATVKLRDQLII